jgi:hypothetical protein
MFATGVVFSLPALPAFAQDNDNQSIADTMATFLPALLWTGAVFGIVKLIKILVRYFSPYRRVLRALNLSPRDLSSNIRYTLQEEIESFGSDAVIRMGKSGGENMVNALLRGREFFFNAAKIHEQNAFVELTEFFGRNSWIIFMYVLPGYIDNHSTDELLDRDNLINWLTENLVSMEAVKYSDPEAPDAFNSALELLRNSPAGRVKQQSSKLPSPGRGFSPFAGRSNSGQIILELPAAASGLALAVAVAALGKNMFPAWMMIPEFMLALSLIKVCEYLVRQIKGAAYDLPEDIGACIPAAGFTGIFLACYGILGSAAASSWLPPVQNGILAGDGMRLVISSLAGAIVGGIGWLVSERLVEGICGLADFLDGSFLAGWRARRRGVDEHSVVDFMEHLKEVGALPEPEVGEGEQISELAEAPASLESCSYLTLAQTFWEYQGVADIVVRAVRAAVEVRGIPLEERAARRVGIWNRYCLDDRYGEFLASLPYDESVQPVTEIEIQCYWDNLCQLCPELQLIPPKQDLLFEIAELAGVLIYPKTEEILRRARQHLNGVVGGGASFASVYKCLAFETPEVCVLLLKWLGNLAEQEIPAARDFLQRYVHQYLDDHRDLLEAFSECVFQKVAQRKAEDEENRCSGKVIVAIVQAGAEPLGIWLREMARLTGQDIAFRDFVMNSPMCRRLRKTCQQPQNLIADRSYVDLAADSITEVRGHLQWSGLVGSETHILFIDTGFRGTIAYHLLDAMKEERTGFRYVMLAFAGEPFYDGFITGLNERLPGEDAPRCFSLAAILDKGFEHFFMTPAYLQKDPIPTPRPWFAALVAEEIRAMAVRSAASMQGKTKDRSHPLAAAA